MDNDRKSQPPSVVLLTMHPYSQHHRHVIVSEWLARLAIAAFCMLLGCSAPNKGRTSVPIALGTQHRQEVLESAKHALVTPKTPIQPVSYQSQKYGGEIFQNPNCVALPRVVTPVQSADSDGITLDLVESLAIQRNPAIQQAMALASKAEAVHVQVGLKPNPSLAYFAQEIGNEGAAGLHGAFLSQTIVRGNKLQWNRNVHSHDVQFARWLAEVQRARVRNDVRIKFYEALGAQERLELASRFRMVAEKGVDATRDLVAAQEGARADILQSEVQLGEVDLIIQQTQFEYDAAWQELMALTGTSEFAPSKLVGELSANTATDRDVDSVYWQLCRESPLLAAASAQVRREYANLQRQRVQPVSNLNAQIGAGYDDATGDEFASVQLSMPIPVHNKNQGNIHAAYADYVAATQNVERLKMKLRRDLAKAIRSYNVAQATVQQLENLILPNVAETLEIMQTAQALGEFDFLRVFTARRAYFDANLKYVTALTDLAKADANLEGLLLTGGLEDIAINEVSDTLRGTALNGR